jgi:hypothetical protein
MDLSTNLTESVPEAEESNSRIGPIGTLKIRHSESWARESSSGFDRARAANYSVTLSVIRARAQQRIRFDAQAGVSQFIANKIDFQGSELYSAYAAEVVDSIGSTIDGSSFSGLLTRVEIGHIRMGSAGNGRIKSEGSGSSPRPKGLPSFMAMA